MKNQITTFLLLLCSFSSLLAQNSITGKIIDNKNEGIFYATVALYNQADSTIAKAASTEDDGSFKIDGLKDGDYFLEVSMLGYANTKFENIDFPRDNNKTFDLTLSDDSQLLSEVEVTARKPLLEQKADRLIVNVENNITSLSGNLLDVMKKVPGLYVVNDKLRMAGQSNFTILINGKTTQYMDVESLLKDMPGDNIKKVEVIHQPGAEFDAAGTGAVINIILKKNSLFGTNGKFNTGIAKGNDWKYTSSVSLSHYQGPFNISGSVGWRSYPYWDELSITRNVGGDVYDAVTDDPGENNSIRADLSLDWDITDKHRVGFSGRYLDWWADFDMVTTTKIDFQSTEFDDIELITTNNNDENWKLRTINPYYTFEIDTAGQKLEFDVNIVQIKNAGTTTLTSEEMNFGEFFAGKQYRQPGETNIFTTKLDYTLPINKTIKLQFGGKYSTAELDNDLGAFDEIFGGGWIDDPLQSNHFIFSENIAAGYGKATWEAGKWSGTVGLRYEDSHSEGNSITLDTTLYNDIEKLFPSLSLKRELTKELAATFAYSNRIDRPRYSNLNPFVYFLDQFTFERGNPSLLPALTHSMKFNLTYENQPFFNIEYKLTDDVMVEVTEQDDVTGLANLTTVNLDKFKNFTASLFFPLDFIPGISGYGGYIANYGKYSSDYLNERFDRSKWDHTAFIQAEFMLPGKINSEVSGWFNSGSQDGIINAQWLYGVDVGFSKKILKDKAKVSFGVENLFARYLTADIKYANMDMIIRNRWDGPVMNAQFSYKFGNQHMKGKKGRSSSARDELNRAQKN